MKIQFVSDTDHRGKPLEEFGFKRGGVYDLEDASAMHWIKRQVATEVIEEPEEPKNKKAKKKK